MSLKYKFRKAQEIIDQLGPNGRKGLEEICKDIQAAEADLQNAARPQLTVCNTRCEGLCCRNIEPDSLISLGDMVLHFRGGQDGVPRHLEGVGKRKAVFYKEMHFLEGGGRPLHFSSGRQTGNMCYLILFFGYSGAKTNRKGNTAIFQTSVVYSTEENQIFQKILLTTQ